MGRYIARLASLVFVLAAAIAMRAEAQSLTVDPGTSIGSPPSFAGTGLFGVYSNSNVSTTQSLATFLAPIVCFPNCSSSSFSDGSGGLLAFTNGHITDVNFNPNFTPPTTWDNSHLTLSGYIDITQPGTYTFFLGSDDNSHLTLSGQDFLDINGCCTTVSGTATFSQAGLYPVLVNFMEFGGGSYLDLTANGPTGSCYFGCLNSTPVDSGLLYSDTELQSAPAPGIGAGDGSLAALIALVMGRLVRQRRAALSLKSVLLPSQAG